MSRCIRYLIEAYLKPTLGISLLFSALGIVCSQWLKLEFFDSYYFGLPIVVATLLFLFSLPLATYELEIPLSMGARRQSLYAAVLLMWVVAAVLCLAITVLTAWIPQWLGWAEGTGFPLQRSPSAWFPLLLFYLLIQSVGACSGRLMATRHKILGGILMGVFWFLAIVLIVFAMIIADSRVDWGLLRPAAVIVILALIAVFSVILHRSVRRAVVH